MKEEISKELQRLQGEIQEASAELAAAAHEYEERRRKAQIKLTHAQGQLATIVSLISK